MLQSFTGTFDEGGLRSFRFERDQASVQLRSQEEVAFWVAIDSSLIPGIVSTLWSGARVQALHLLVHHSAFMGAIAPNLP